MDERLSERKRKILHAIIQNYLESGEPVGSRTISKYTDLNLSSATIRNEMSDLEELGYIVQPHTSAGFGGESSSLWNMNVNGFFCCVFFKLKAPQTKQFHF